MAPRRFDATRVHRIPEAPTRLLSGPHLRHRLVVVAPTVAEVVQSAGGWLFDQMVAGWDVLVLTADRGDERPLRILGATAVGLESALASPLRGPQPQAVAVAAALYRTDPRIRARLDAAFDAGLVDVRVWDHRDSPGPDDDPAAMPYTPSAAARAFKRQALVAAAVPTDTCAAPEVFHGLASARSLATV